MSPRPFPYITTCTSSNVVYYGGQYWWPSGSISTIWNVAATATSADGVAYYTPYIPLYPQTVGPPYPHPAPEQAQWAEPQPVIDEVEVAQGINAWVRDHQAQRAAADEKARKLLARLLSQEQRARYETQREFEILTCRNGEVRRYLIKEGHAGNIVRLDANGTAIERYCIHTDESIPAPDNMVAQKLLLEADEETFLKIANRSIAYPGGVWVAAPRAA
jgi:hypothetical protein